MSKISFDGIGEVAATFFCTEQVKAGAVVKVSGDCTVDACAAGNRFCGVAISAEDGCAAVQVGGFATVQVSGEGVSAGMVKLSADGSGGVKLDAANGAEYLVAAVDSAAGTAAVLL